MCVARLGVCGLTRVFSRTLPVAASTTVISHTRPNRSVVSVSITKPEPLAETSRAVSSVRSRASFNWSWPASARRSSRSPAASSSSARVSCWPFVRL